LGFALPLDLCAEHAWVMPGSSDCVDSETTHEIPRIFDGAAMVVLSAATLAEDEC
jgi:hypothetical protein